MPNPGGKNGYGIKNYPPDDVLRETLEGYVKLSLQQAQKLARLKEDHDLSIGVANLNQIERRLKIPSLIDEVEPDVTQSNGPRYVKSKLKDKLILVPRHVMLEHFGDGFNARYPGRKKVTIATISADGHEKLAAQALKMGDIGFPIYAWKDKWTAYFLRIAVVPDCRTAGAVGHLYLDFLDEIEFAPMQLNTDKGSETARQYAIQTAIRVHNIIIEAFWRWLKEKWGVNMREHILRGKNERIYVPEVAFHQGLVNWIFPPLIQSQLKFFRMYWNQYTIRTQSEKDMPSGHAPADALKHPALFGGKIQVPKEAIQEFRDALTEEVGPRESFLSWVSPEFDQLAKEITLENAWDVFRDISAKMEALV
ncbi:hypothetical protein B0H13DRAFT_2239812 [Mycena leptocephala]|nr:hypothetical protein B0H13DRAFT_2239812 [Mycena leptocephala]